MATAQQQLAEIRLGEDPVEWIARHRKEGVPWAEMAYRFREQTGYTVSAETLRRWARADSQRPERRSA